MFKNLVTALFIFSLFSFSQASEKELSAYYGISFMTDGDTPGDTIGFLIESRNGNWGWGLNQSLTVGNSRGTLSLLFSDDSADEKSYVYESIDSLMLAVFGSYRADLLAQPTIDLGVSLGLNKNESWTLYVQDFENNFEFGGPNSTTHKRVLGGYLAFRLTPVKTDYLEIDIFGLARGVRFEGPEGYSAGIAVRL